MTRCLSSERGIASIEFLISFLPFLLLFVGGVQLASIATARLVVQHAAVQAARAAVVTIDDDPVFYEDGQRKHLEAEGSGAGGDQNLQVLRAAKAQSIGGGHDLGARGTARMNRVRNAAYLPLSVISPTFEQVTRWLPLGSAINPALDEHSLAGEIGDSPLVRVITGLGIYGRVGAAVSFPVAPGTGELHDESDIVFGDRDTVTVRVTYLFPCNVPLARSLVCKSLADMSGIPDALRSSLNELDEPSEQSVRSAVAAWKKDFPEPWRQFRQHLSELLHAEWAHLLVLLVARTDERFLVLRGEASLPNQGAAYRYYSELKKEGNEGSAP